MKKKCCLISLLVVLSGCSANVVRCDGSMRPINSLAAVVQGASLP